ncbi:MAG: sensor histidine kinase [Catenulispora sp.]
MRKVGHGLRDVARAGARSVRGHPQAVDGAVAVAMLTLSLVWLDRYPYQPGRHRVYSTADFQGTSFRAVGVLGFTLTVLTCVTIALRRWWPVPMMWSAAAMLIVYSGLDYPPTTLAWCPLFVFYTLTTRRQPSRVVHYAALVVIVWLQYSLRLAVLGIALAVLQTLVVVAVVWVFGNQTRLLAERNERLAQLTAQVRREQAARAREAVARERVRIARELHDVVAHHMSVISVQTNLARYVVGTDPGTAEQALGTIGDANHEAMREMRRMLTVLRPVPEDDAPEPAYRLSVEPAPGLARLAALLDRVRSAGVETELRILGSAFPLAPGPDLCCYRIVQESLTNVMKHAPGARVLVEITYQGHDVTVRIADSGGRVGSRLEAADAVPAAPGPAVAGTGNGLVGMRERARIYGGTLSAGPRAAGGFEVVLTLPGEREDDPEA